MKIFTALTVAVLGLSSIANAGDAFSYDRIEFTSIRDEGKNADYMTVHARVCMFYNIYTSEKGETPINCSIPIAYSPILKDNQLAKAAEAELELSIWEPKGDIKKVKREFLKIKSMKLNSDAFSGEGETQYLIEAENENYNVKMVTTYSLRSKDGSEDLVLSASDKENSNTMTVTKKVGGKLAAKPILISTKPSVIVTSLGENL